MKPEFAASFIAAVVLHAVLLFVVRVGAPARPLALSDDPSPVDVNLVETAPEEPPASAPPVPAPVPTSEPISTPPPIPPTPEPTSDMSTPPPEATPAPEPPREKPKTRPAERRRPAKTTASSSTAPNTALSSQTANHGGAANGPLGSHARYRSNPKPDYPPDALQRHEEGLVVLSVDVSADGSASGITLKRSSGYDLLDQAAIQGVRRWTFEPARAAGVPVSSRVDVPVRFSLSDYSR